MTDLFPTWAIGSIELTDYPYSVDRESSVEIGEPEMVVQSTPSSLADGDRERVVRHGNRTYVIPVYIEGPTLLDVAEAEAALRAELRRDGLELAHNPGDDFSPVSVYEVQTARLSASRDDRHESHLLRKFTLTLTCSPFARSRSAVVVDALDPPPVTPTTVTINGADTTTGWTASANYSTGNESAQPSVVDLGLDGVSTSASCQVLGLTYIPASPIALTGTQYVTVEASGSGPLAFFVQYAGDPGLIVPTQRLVRALPGGKTQYVLDVNPAKSLSRITIFWPGEPGRTDDQPATVNVFDVSRTDTLAQVTPRQISRIIGGRGTERTPGSIHVSSPASGTDLAHTIVHTCPETGTGYSPPLRRWRFDGNSPVTTEAARFSGAYEATEPDAFVAQVPNSALPAGDYLLVARLYSTAAGTFTVSWAASTIVNSVPQDQQIGDESVTFPAAGWHTFPLAVLSLPTVRSLGPVTQISIQTSTGDAVTTQLDEAWLFLMGEDCGLTIVQNPTENLWLDSPDITSGVPRVWIGDIDDRSDARHPASGLQAFGSHIISPGGTALFTAAEVDNPAASAQFYPRWHSNAAE